MSKKQIIVGVLTFILSLTIAFVCKGQTNTNDINNKKLLIVKFEKTIKKNEPKFIGGRTGESGEYPVELKSGLSWKFDGAKVDADVSDYISEAEAIKYFKLNYTENVASPLRSSGVKLTNLGDEAWMIPINTNYEHSRTQLVLRKGTVKIFVRATSNALAIRFAEYFVQVIEKHNNKTS